MKMYQFNEVLTKEELELLKKYNIPLECERKKEALHKVIHALVLEEISERVELIADKLRDNLERA